MTDPTRRSLAFAHTADAAAAAAYKAKALNCGRHQNRRAASTATPSTAMVARPVHITSEAQYAPFKLPKCQALDHELPGSRKNAGSPPVSAPCHELSVIVQAYHLGKH